jgi:hypothetical protein
VIHELLSQVKGIESYLRRELELKEAI